MPKVRLFNGLFQRSQGAGHSLRLFLGLECIAIIACLFPGHTAVD
ncbi:hypothetical protein [Pseudomonas sp. S9]|nr:hypothetical protein [Pseudomonas sp. S9]